MKLEGKSVVVTGASSGMGKAIVELFAREGAGVIAMARRKERLETLAQSLEDTAGRVVPFVGDVSKEEDNIAAIELAVKEFGKLDILVNNAGIMDDMSPVGEVTNEKLESVFSVNFFGPVYAMRKAVQVFLEQNNGGNIINVASEGAVRPCAGAVYCASKAAVVSLTKTTAYMYMPQNIRCNVIAPGGIMTEISTAMGRPNPSAYQRLQGVLQLSPPMGEAADIANAALFLASGDSRYINGNVLFVDGGWSVC